MGDVVYLDDYRKRLDDGLSSREKARKAYSELERAETRLFGKPEGMSFLELIADEAPAGHPDPNHFDLLKSAAYLSGKDLEMTRYTDFIKYNPIDYEDFLVKAMTYFRMHEPEELDPVYRLVSVARDLFRHGYGLPRSTDTEGIRKYRRTPFGKLNHAFWNWRVNKRLKKIGFDVANTKYRGVISSKTSPGCSSETSSQGSS